jgi:Do/DeqQ family serine protease
MKQKFLYIFLTGFISFFSDVRADSFLSETQNKSPLKKNDSSMLYELQNTFHDIYNQYKDSVVFISTEKTITMKSYNPFTDDPVFREFFGLKENTPKKRKARGLGTGFIISSDGYICTNAHVIQNVDTVTVTVAEKSYEAKIIGSDTVTDIALLKIKSSRSFKPVYFGDSDSVKVGDFVLAIGNPFGLDKTFTQGIVSGTGRNQLDETGNAHIQTDAAINQGNSGGPLINLDGEVIGVNRAIYSSSGGNIGIGFAIPINVAKQTLLQLKSYGKVKRGYLGIGMTPFTLEQAKQLGLLTNQGVLVGSVIKESPADKGGILVGDVILMIDDQPIKEGISLIRFIGSKKIGEVLIVKIWRNRSEKSLRVVIKERP